MSKKISKVCLRDECDIVFWVYPNPGDSSKKYCSQKCASKSRSEALKIARANPESPVNVGLSNTDSSCTSDCTCNRHVVTEETRQKLSQVMKDVFSDVSLREQMSERTRLSWKREEVRNSRIRGIETAWSNVELRQKHSEIMKSVFDTPEDRERRSRDMKSARADPESPVNIALQAIEGNRPGQWSKSAGYHNGVYMRCLNSEGVFAQELDEAGIEWVYEPEGFKLSWCIYYPDFYLPEFDIWVEVKGWMTERAQEKIDTFRRETGKTLIVVQQDELPTLVYETKTRDLVGVAV